MGAGMSDADRSRERAGRLLRWYPRAWRDRYGEEFAELLVADLEEQPRSWRRTADIAVSGLGARLSTAGLGSGPISHPQAGLAAVGAASVGFGACGVSLWSQLIVGSRASLPDSQAAKAGLVVMSIGVAYLAIMALLAAVPVVAAAGKALRGNETRRFIGPIALTVLGATGLVVGGHHLQGGWPGTGGRPGLWHHLVPGSVGGFGWAETLGLTAYWAHPSELFALPTDQLVWTLLSPILSAATLAGAVMVVRRVTLSAAALDFEVRLAKIAAIGMVPYLGSAAWWVLSSPTDSNAVFRAGSLDVLLVASMVIALVVAHTATQRVDARRSHSPL
jgi:hypothetical protein